MSQYIKLILLVVCFCLLVSNARSNDVQGITCRASEPRDLAQLIAIDREISFEFFEPLYAQFYHQYDFGKHPHYYLTKELVADEILFKSVLSGAETNVKIVVAHDKNNMAGFVVASRVDVHEAEIDLLLVKKEFRRKHAGACLVAAALKLFPGVATCSVYPFRFGNEATLTFYEKMGFKRIGLAPARINAYGANAQELNFHYQYVFNPETTPHSVSVSAKRPFLTRREEFCARYRHENLDLGACKI